jgi:chromosomal replication initiator protein
MELISIEEGQARLGVPNLFMKEWIRQHYLPAIKRAIHSVTGAAPEVDITISPRLFQAKRQEQAGTSDVPAPSVAAQPVGAVASRQPVRGPGPGGPRLNPELTLENFITGSSNRLAFEAARIVSESPASRYNPLFVHGGPGLGKTHLLQAVCNRMRELRPDSSITYMPCEEFTNTYISALQSGRLPAFREQCRSTDCLVIDDVHFLAAKEHTQEEFFHTFDVLHNRGRQVVLSSDAHPREISDLSAKLQTRFVGGLVAALEPPDVETRLAIVKAKAARRSLTLPDDVAQMVAQRVDGSVREIEGAVASLCAASRLIGRPLDLQHARAALRQLASLRSGPLTVDHVLAAVEKRFAISAAELRGSGRSRRVILPRQVAMYLARRHTDMSLSEIGRHFSGRDHATVLYAERRVQDAMAADPELAGTVNEISETLQG